MKSINHTHEQRGVLHKPWEHTALKVLSWTGLGTAGLALAPLVFPQFSLNAVPASANAIARCIKGEPSGLVKPIYDAFEGTVGASLISGGWPTALVSGGLAVGGLWLANYVDKRTEQGAFRWGSVIRWAALTTSILISLPTILTAMSMGINFFSFWAGSEGPSALGSAIGSLGAKGAASGMGAAASAAGLASIHALTCALPLGITGFFLGQKEEPKKPTPILQLPALNAGRLTPPLPLARVGG
jgi:hypothetical protein